MSVKLLTEQHLEFLSLKGGFTGLSESTLVEIPHCWKSHVTAHDLHIRLIFIQLRHRIPVISSMFIFNTGMEICVDQLACRS